MEMLKRLEPLWLTLVLLGALNWGMIGIFDTNLVTEIFGTGDFVDVVYAMFGIAGLFMLPRLFASFEHMSDHHVHPHGA